GPVRASAGDGGFVLDGTAGLVSEGAAAGLFLVTAADDDGGVTQFLVPADAPGVEVVPLGGLDLTRRFVDVRFSGVELDAEAVLDARPTASEIVSIAKAYAGDAGAMVGQMCLQAHGGIGFTWEHDLHFYLRRLEADRVLYGDPVWHRERICRIHGLGAHRGD